MKIYQWYGGFCFLFFLLFSSVTVSAQEMEEYIKEVMEEQKISLEEIETAIEDSSIGDSVSVEDVFEKLMDGDLESIGRECFQILKESLFSELKQNRRYFVQIILLAVFAALFSNLASGMFGASLEQTGFFVVYLAVSGVVLQSFYLMISVTQQVLQEVFQFMEVFLPVYAMVITMVSGSVTSIALYEFTFLLVKGCQWTLHKVILPLIEMFMIIGIINCLSEKDRFSHMSRLVKFVAESVLKWAAAFIIGLNLVQNMILPAVDSLKSSLWQKGLSAIPGAGGILSVITGTMLGAAVLIKNSIGVVCMMILVLLCAVPVIKLLIFILSYFICSAVMQPISEKRFLNLLQVTGESGKLLLQALIVCFVLFFVTIALAAVSTNMRYYAG